MTALEPRGLAARRTGPAWSMVTVAGAAILVDGLLALLDDEFHPNARVLPLFGPPGWLVRAAHFCVTSPPCNAGLVGPVLVN